MLLLNAHWSGSHLSGLVPLGVHMRVEAVVTHGHLGPVLIDVTKTPPCYGSGILRP